LVQEGNGVNRNENLLRNRDLLFADSMRPKLMDEQTMINISLSNTSCSLGGMDILKAASFVPFGAGATFCNIIIVFALMKQKNLRKRKEYLILIGLAFADFAEGGCTFCLISL
jgi:hypothetical protein